MVHLLGENPNPHPAPPFFTKDYPTFLGDCKKIYRGGDKPLYCSLLDSPEFSANNAETVGQLLIYSPHPNIVNLAEKSAAATSFTKVRH